ncbi:MAG: hypothetical protein ACYC8S_01910 [Minisyncoccota bacterium]
MTKPKPTKKNINIPPERLVELQRANIIASTGASVRLSGSKVTNKQVEQILKSLNRI